jgi:hypothetical protein
MVERPLLVADPGREATAHHEAGHAAAHLHFNLRFRYVTIKPSDGAYGHVRPLVTVWRPDRNRSARSEREMRQHVMCSFAGAIAETKFTGVANHGGASADRKNAIDLLSLFCGSEAQIVAYAEHLLLCAVRMLELPAVRAVHGQLVSELLRRDTLTWTEAHTIQRAAIEALIRSG